jgi:hypothetical protein
MVYSGRMQPGDVPQGSSEPLVVVCPHLDVEHQRGVNFVWAASLELAWKRLMQLAGGPIEIEGLHEDEPAAKLVRALNQSPIDENLDADSLFSWAGPATEEAVASLRKDLASLLGHEFPAQLPRSHGADRISVWGGFSMAPRFNIPLARYPKSRTFLGHHGYSFGVWWNENDPAELWLARRSQLIVHFPRYTDEEADELSLEEVDAMNNYCVIELRPADSSVSIIYATLPRGVTLRNTIESALSMMTTDDTHPNAHFTTEEKLRIPAIKLACEATFSELSGQRITNLSLRDKVLGELGLSIRFHFEGGEGSSPTDPPSFGLMSPIRSYSFDTPSLLMVVTRQAHNPLFVLWADKPGPQIDLPPPLRFPKQE